MKKVLTILTIALLAVACVTKTTNSNPQPAVVYTKVALNDNPLYYFIDNDTVPGLMYADVRYDVTNYYTVANTTYSFDKATASITTLYPSLISAAYINGKTNSNIYGGTVITQNVPFVSPINFKNTGTGTLPSLDTDITLAMPDTFSLVNTPTITANKPLRLQFKKPFKNVDWVTVQISQSGGSSTALVRLYDSTKTTLDISAGETNYLQPGVDAYIEMTATKFGSKMVDSTSLGVILQTIVKVNNLTVK